MKLPGPITSAMRLASDVKTRMMYPNAIPVVYFTEKNNVGDLLNEFLIPRISGRAIVKVKSTMQPHFRGIGSVLGSASNFSRVWGSGSIDGTVPRRKLRKENIFALRGHHTLEVVKRNLDDDLDRIPLGDPALLMPSFFCPQSEPHGRVGIVPHFSDEEKIREYVSANKVSGVEIVSVRQDPESFVNQMHGCKAIYSSSLHGLILADSYGIPNKWISISNKLLGGTFKFLDYYSVTAHPEEDLLRVDTASSLQSLIAHPEKYCSVKKFKGDLDELLESFPDEYREKPHQTNKNKYKKI